MGYLEANEHVKPRTEKVHYVDFAQKEPMFSDPAASTKFARITMPGPIDQIDIPATWTKTEKWRGRFEDGYYAAFKHPSSPDVAIGFNSSGDPNKAGVGNLDKLLADANAKLIYSSKWEQQADHVAHGPRETYAKEVARKLQQIMGPSDQGSNQLTTGPGAATHLDKLETKAVNGKTILSVEGHYINGVTRMPSSYFVRDTIPYKTAAGGTEIHTATLVADSKAALEANKAIYAHVLNSVQWRNAAK